MSDELQVVDVEALKVEAAVQNAVHLTDRQVRDMMERSIARSHCSPQGLAHLFPGLGRKK